MRLTKLFNFPYLLQNIKKSKGLMILLALVVPMFTSILLLSIDSDTVLSFQELAVVNMIGMYIIPIVLSMALFNYIYKKNSVDFMGSMPLTRKTIFVTNTIGGIGIIVLLQLLTLICTVLLSRVLSNVILFGSMAWDVFVYYTIAYIFVFAVSNLAMSFSGNKFSQLVAIALILFLIPFILITSKINGVYLTTPDTIDVVIQNSYHFTATSSIFDMIINGDGYEFDSVSIWKMVALSVIYTIVGLILFDKKKLEMAGESYENPNVHLLIKFLTFVPFMTIFCALNDSDRISVLLFFIAILAVYYFVFDLITNKKIKAKVSVGAFVISFIVMFALVEGVVPKLSNINREYIDYSEIQSVTLDTLGNGVRRKFVGLEIDNPELIKFVIDGVKFNYSESSMSYYNGVDDIRVEVVPQETTSSDFVRPAVAYDFNFNITLKLKNGKEHTINRYLNDNVVREIIKEYGNEPIVRELNHVAFKLGTVEISSEAENEIREVLKDELTNMTVEKWFDICDDNDEVYQLDVYEYTNHKLLQHRVSSDKFEKLFSKVVEIYNSYTPYNLDRISHLRVENIDYGTEVSDKYIMSDVSYEATEELKEFVLKDKDNIFDVKKEYTVLKTYYPEYLCYYTNNVEAVKQIMLEVYNTSYIKEKYN